MTRRHRRVTRPATGRRVGEGEAGGKVIGEPEQTVDDTDRGWGEPASDSTRDRWLREQRPPHWE